MTSGNCPPIITITLPSRVHYSARVLTIACVCTRAPTTTATRTVTLSPRERRTARALLTESRSRAPLNPSTQRRAHARVPGRSGEKISKNGKKPFPREETNYERLISERTCPRVIRKRRYNRRSVITLFAKHAATVVREQFQKKKNTRDRYPSNVDRPKRFFPQFRGTFDGRKCARSHETPLTARKTRRHLA